MNTETTGLFRKVLGLAEKDRIILTGLLIESLDETQDSDAEALWRAEADKRLEELDSGRFNSWSNDLKKDCWRSAIPSLSLIPGPR